MRLSYMNGRAVAEVTSLPGCSQVAVIHAANVLPEFRGRGFGMEAHLDRLNRLRGELAYDYAICTADKDNAAQIKILERAGWTMFDSFLSGRTRHLLSIWGKPLR